MEGGAQRETTGYEPLKQGYKTGYEPFERKERQQVTGADLARILDEPPHDAVHPDPEGHQRVVAGCLVRDRHPHDRETVQKARGPKGGEHRRDLIKQGN